MGSHYKYTSDISELISNMHATKPKISDKQQEAVNMWWGKPHENYKEIQEAKLADIETPSYVYYDISKEKDPNL